MNTVIHGIFTRAGTFPVREQEVTGFLIETSREKLVEIKHLPMYDRVAICDAEALSIRRFEHVLLAHGLIDVAAINDPEGFDNYRTHGAIQAAHRELISGERETK